MIETLRHLLRQVDAVQRRHVSLSFPFAVVRKMADDGGGSLAAQIGYYGFLAVFPLMLVFAAVLGFVLVGHPGLKDHVVHTTESSFPALSGYIDKHISGNSLALGLGLVGALWAGLGVTRATERAMNNIWDIPMADRPNLWWSRLRGLGMLCILGATFLISTFLAAARGSGGSLRPATEALGIVGPLALNFVLYLLAFQVLTNRHLAWRCLVPGAVVGAAGWTLLQNLGAIFVRHEVSHASHLYGSLATVVGILVWIYLGAQLTLYAAEINVVLVHRLWPRSLIRGYRRTDADRRALTLQAQEVQRGAGASISVAFDVLHGGDVDGVPVPVPGESSAPSPPSPPDRGVVEEFVAHLRALDRGRGRLSDCTDADERDRLLRHVHAEAVEAAQALDSLLGEDPDLATAFAEMNGRQ